MFISRNAEDRFADFDAALAVITSPAFTDERALNAFLAARTGTPAELQALVAALHVYRPEVYARLDRQTRSHEPVTQEYHLQLPRLQLHLVAGGYGITNTI